MTDTIIEVDANQITISVPRPSIVGDALIVATANSVTFTVPSPTIITQFNVSPYVTKLKVDKPKLTEFRVIK